MELIALRERHRAIAELTSVTSFAIAEEPSPPIFRLLQAENKATI